MAGKGIVRRHHVVVNGISVALDGRCEFNISLVLSALHIINARKEFSRMIVGIVEIALLVDVDPGFVDGLAQSIVETEIAMKFVQLVGDRLEQLLQLGRIKGELVALPAPAI